MNQPSAFQTQYPLSPKKFWKKIFPNLITYFILSILLGLGVGAVVFFGSGGSGGAAYLGSALVCTLIIYIILISLNAWYIKIYIKRYYYDCSDQFVTIKKGVFTPTEIHVQYPKIQDVYVDQDLLDRLMGLYDVHIASATVTSGIEAHFDGVEQPVAEAIKNFLLAKIQGGSMPSTVPIPGQPAGMAPTPPMPPRATSFQSATKVSTETFPISGAWTFSAIIGAFFYSLLLTLIFGSWIGRLAADVFSAATVSSTDSGSILGYAFLLFLLIFFGRIIWVLLWKSSYYFEFLPDYILLRTGVISRSENHLPYKSIQNVTNKQGIIERILGIATVSVENAAFVNTTQKSFSLSGGGGSSRSAGIALVGQPRERADQLNQILNQITSAQGNTSISMGV
jgi:uncharacterized membrane protein YdbT with pleckstrin-like domain